MSHGFFSRLSVDYSLLEYIDSGDVVGVKVREKSNTSELKVCGGGGGYGGGSGGDVVMLCATRI